jgi:Serine carboxypeptidase S28
VVCVCQTLCVCLLLSHVIMLSPIPTPSLTQPTHVYTHTHTYTRIHTHTHTVFWNNGKLDGWHGLSVQPGPNNDFQQSVLIANASHCEDMYGSAVEPNQEMKEAHSQNSAAITQWLQQWSANRQSHPFRPDDDDSD